MRQIKTFVIFITIVILSLSLVSIVSALPESTIIKDYDFGKCQMCHADVAENFSTSLHYKAYGMMSEYEKGAAGHYGIDMDVFYEEGKCANCHVTSCTICHTDDPHYTEITINTCDPCHKKKQTSLYIGDMPNHNGEGVHADIHYEKGLICNDCHSTEEMHGDGTIYEHQLTAVKTACEDCHINPGKVVNGMDVTQYTTETSAHETHDEKLSCTACHTGWTVTCVNCHLETRKVDGIVIDQFYLAVGTDGLIQPFLKQSTSYGNDTHTGYAAWMSHTITDEPKNCEFCHENRDVLCENCEGQIMGEGGSFIPQATIDRVIGAHINPTPIPTKAETQKIVPGFELIIAFMGLLSVVLLLRQQRK